MASTQTPDPTAADDGPHDDTPVRPSLDEVDLRITALDLGNEAVFITDPDGTIVEVNDAFVRVTGYSRDEAIGSTPRLLSSGLQDQDFYQDLWDTISSGRVWTGQMVDRRRDGALRSFHSTITPIVDGRGNIAYFVALERDVTSELGSVRQDAAAGLVHTDLLGHGTYADGLAAAALERRPSELLGNGLLHALAERDVDAFRELIEQAVETGREHRTEVRTSAGKWLRVTVSPLTVSSGDILGAACQVEDVDELIAAERAVDDQKALARSTLDAFDDPIAAVGPDGRVVATNRAWGADDDGMPEPIRRATIGSDLVALARTGARHAAGGDRTASRLAEDLQRTLTGVLAAPPRDRGYRVSSLAWDEGGAVVRWIGDAS